jgi:hypothetical protein
MVHRAENKLITFFRGSFLHQAHIPRGLILTLRPRLAYESLCSAWFGLEWKMHGGFHSRSFVAASDLAFASTLASDTGAPL